MWFYVPRALPATPDLELIATRGLPVASRKQGPAARRVFERRAWLCSVTLLPAVHTQPGGLPGWYIPVLGIEEYFSWCSWVLYTIYYIHSQEARDRRTGPAGGCF